ncbi:hypothetical protein ACN28S_26505 [Cystobacter fuscus]
MVALTRTKSDTGQLNIDSLALLKSGDAYPQAARTCGFGALCEAEALALTGRMHRRPTTSTTPATGSPRASRAWVTRLASTSTRPPPATTS